MSDDNVIDLAERRKKKKRGGKKTTAQKITDALKRFGSHGGLVHKKKDEKKSEKKDENKDDGEE